MILQNVQSSFDMLHIAYCIIVYEACSKQCSNGKKFLFMLCTQDCVPPVFEGTTALHGLLAIFLCSLPCKCCTRWHSTVALHHICYPLQLQWL